ncbi:hypothetical protein J5N97_010911 [Dioscorea zingiberensis]|uniref:Protein phosphatase n=1 Tax=Dioscorea zingiberensis TaxID=325984 RepID=A0A9D5CZL3_9LILI|nr:hypothetical protein J5N97_010911 [Dioscorea zingiberensis]
MPSTQHGLQTRTLFFAYAWFSLPRSLSSVGNIPHLFPRSAASAEGALSISGTLARALSLPSVTGPVDSLITESTSQGFPKCLFQRNKMAALSYSPCRGEIGARNFHSLNGNDVQVGGLMKRSGVGYSCKGLDNCRRVSGSLKNREPWGKNMVYRHFWSSANGMSGKSNSLVDSEVRDFHSSCSSQYSAGAAPDVSFDGVVRDEQLENHGVSSDLKILGDRSLKLLSGSCYLPHPDKEETGGEDAHFICVNEQAIGVADGVGGWADIGVNAGLYARELMTNSVNAIQEEPQGSIDPARVLEKAYSSTKARGSSTACIIALTDQGIHAVNLGDSGFIVVREGCTIFRSPVQQHDFNFTFQLESGNGSDLPSSAQVFSFPVASGDVIIAGTDGLFDNLYNNEVTAVVVHATRAGLGPQVTAQKIAALARQRAQDRNRQTPFSTAAQDAGYRYYGGKLDDITVVVSFITESST